jgi:cysteine desulfurase
VDAAQGFGKENDALGHDRIDLISLSGHKLHGPMGIGALIIRRRQGGLAPLSPLMYGGGQELGLRPGTLPVPLIVGFGLAAELAHQERFQRMESCRERRDLLLDRLSPLSPVIHGDLNLALPNTLNLSFPGWDADQVIEALRGIAAVSDGAACTSVCATASHVLSAMGVSAETLDGAVRFSWSHMTPLEDLQRAAELICTRLAPHSVSTRS